MNAKLDTLNEKEREILRLILRGYDVKTAARHLDVSAHTLTERLRSARRKLGVSSSREAALALAVDDVGTNNQYVTTKSGIASSQPANDTLAGRMDEYRSDMLEVQSEQAIFAGSNSFQAFIDTLPLRPEGRVGNELREAERIKAVGELTVKLATAFVFICLAISLINSIINQH
jgi:DNA-binding CsgD family transcriptional regulator